MTTFKVPVREEVSASSQQSFDTLKKALGMVPNLYATLAYSENALSRFLAFQNAPTSLSNKEKEAVNLVVSQVNSCKYCLSAHTMLGKLNGFSEEEILLLRKGQSTIPKTHALVQLAKDLTENKGHAAAANLEAFFEAGYNKGNLVDLLLLIADKTALNYLHNLTEVPVDFPPVPELN
ncbi:carboxymuconolactone decarboxylase family protein [Chitinophaga niabensis]|uniref:carboxymuconolactone decarboxylase family protein n=1 Tax=Chitinophaga niabensis TaxID=536979 RepID=UPI0031BB26E9